MPTHSRAISLRWIVAAAGATLASAVSAATLSRFERPAIRAEIAADVATVEGKTLRAAAESAIAVKRQRAAAARMNRKVDGALEVVGARVAQTLAQRTSSPGPASGVGEVNLETLSVPLLSKIAGDGAIQIYVYTDTNPSFRLSSLEAAGLNVELVIPTARLVQGTARHDQIEAIAALEFVTLLTLPDYPVRRRGSVTTQGDSLLRVDLVRQMSSPGPYTGAGIKVGIISDAATNVATAVATGDLPSGITMHPTFRFAGDESTAMAEIVHDLAPDAQLFIAGPSTSAEMISSIDWLVAQGCQVIVDDLGFYSQPYFEDGTVAVAARNAVVNSGRVFVTAAGNDALNHYQGTFSNSGSGLHDFKSGAGSDNAFDIVVPAGGTVSVILQWNDRFGASGNDYDLYLGDPSTGVIVAGSEFVQSGFGTPRELLTWTNNSGVSKTMHALVALYSGTTSMLEMFIIGNAFGNDDDSVPGDSVMGHPAVSDVIAVGTINATNPGLQTAASYSSRGPSTISFPSAETRQTPLVMAVDGVAVSGAGGFPTSFFGTSAAAPHVAAICALMLQRNPLATPAQIRAALSANAVERGDFGFDYTYGYGLVDGFGAVLGMQVPLPVINTHPQPSATTSGAKATFTVAASGSGLSYRWQRQPAGTSGFADLTEGSVYSGTTTTTLTVSSITFDMHEDQFRCVVSNAHGSATSNVAVLAVNIPPVITSDDSATFSTGVFGSFTVTATGRPAPTFTISGGTFPSWAALDATSGVISGRAPNAIGSPFTFTIRAANSAAAVTQTFTLTVNALPGVVSVKSNGNHIVFLRSDGSVWTTGNNMYGQLGDGTKTPRNIPVQVTTGAVAIAAGMWHTLILKADGTLWGAGSNSFGSLGDGTTLDRATPVQIASDVIGIDAYGHSLFVKSDGTLWGMGMNRNGQLGTGGANERITSPVQIATRVRAMAAGNDHSAFVRTDGTLWTVGLNHLGQLGDGMTTNRFEPIQVATGATLVGCGPYNTQFLKTDGSLWGMGSLWGVDTEHLASTTPIQIGNDVVAFSPGWSHALQIKSDFSIFGAGSAGNGEFGNGTTGQLATPTKIGADGADVAAALNSSFFVKTDGSLWASGRNESGQLGDGSTVQRYLAVLVAAGTVSLPSAPTTLTATRGGSASPLVLNWSPVTGATSFEIWRSASSSETAAQVVARNIKLPRFEDLAAEVGVTYYYWIKAVNPAGVSAYSASASGLRADPPVFASQPASRSVGRRGATSFSVTVNGSGPFTYQWRRNGTAIPGGATATFSIPIVLPSDAGSYDVVVTNAAGSATSGAAVLTVLPNPIAYNSRVAVGSAGVSAYIAIEGTETKHVLLRALGPTLATLGVNGGISDPEIAVFDAAGGLVASNDNWGTVAGVNWPALLAQVGAVALNAGSADAALYATLAPGSYRVRIAGVAGATGLALFEAFDVDTNMQARIGYFGVRAPVTASTGISLGAAMTGAANRRVLIRSVGPTLVGPGVLPDPRLQLSEGSLVVATNDNWGNSPAILTAGIHSNTFPLSANSLDAAILIDREVASGVVTAQIPSGNTGGDALLEFCDINPNEITALAPLIISSPVSTTVAAGEAVSLRVLAVGVSGASYQWRKNGIDVPGATNATHSFNAQEADGGEYAVRISTALSSVVSVPSTLTVAPAVLAGSHSAVGSGYLAGASLAINARLTYPAATTSLTHTATLPAGWTYVSSSSNAGETRPTAGATGTLSWTWTTLPPLPLAFSYEVTAPADASGPVAIEGTLVAQKPGEPAQTVQMPALPINQITTHTADTDMNFRIGLLELTRVIELYNTRNGAIRTGCYRVLAGSEDGFSPDPTRAGGAAVTLTKYHSADANPRDGKINLLELTRVIELYNFRSGAVRTGQYKVQANTEDGFSPGP